MQRVFHILAIMVLIIGSLMAGLAQGAPAKDAKAAFDQGVEFSKKGQNDQAIASFSEAIKLDPKNAVAYNSRGLAYYNTKALDKAIADYNKAIQLDASMVSPYLNRGVAYAAKGQKDKAIADLKKVLELTQDLGLRQKAETVLKELGVK